MGVRTSGDADALADGRLFTLPPASGQRVVDDRHQRGVRGVAVGEEATAPQGDAHGLEVLATDDAPPHDRRSRRRARRRLGHGFGHVAFAAHRHVGDRAEATHAGDRRQPGAELIVELRGTRRVRVGLGGEVGLEADAMRRLEADVVAQQTLQAAQRQAGADDERRGQRDFGDRQPVAQAAGGAAVGDAVGAEDAVRAAQRRSRRARAPNRPRA